MSTMRKYSLWLLLLLTCLCYGQEDSTESNEEGDSKYREDQFYIGASYNLVGDVPSGFSPRGLSGGIQLGYLRDMPINEDRTIAIAVGAGLTYDQYGENLFIGAGSTGETVFTILDESEVNFDSNRLSTAAVELPVEIRWRSSTSTSYKFWRVYAGFRVSYVYWHKATFKQSGGNESLTNIPELDKVQLGASLSFGYNTVNFFAYYGITPLFSNASTADGQNVGFNSVKLGLIFYIL